MDSKTGREMPRYKCYKVVWALKIKDIRLEAGEAWPNTRRMVLVPEEEGYTPVTVTREYMSKHKPEVGGYYVVYEDGYKSFSPVEPFESGYTRIS